MELPEKINRFLVNKQFTENSVGKTNSKVYIYDEFVLKIQEKSSETLNEYKIMKLLNNILPIPKCIEYIEEKGLSYLLMSKIDGEMISENKYISNPEILIDLLSDGLKKLWLVDINKFNINNVSNIYERLKIARYNVENNLVDMNNVMPETFGDNGFSSPADLLEWLEKNIPDQDLVFTHGDFCFENILVENYHINGFIDLGKAGIADRWQDLAICIRELDEVLNLYKDLNYTSDILLEKLEIEKDEKKLKYYMLLDELF